MTTKQQSSSSGQKIGYVRVSSVDQNDARQLDGLVLDKIFTDKASGKDVHRPQLQALLSHVREGDHVYVHSMDRLSRSLKDLQEVAELLTARGVAVEFCKENLKFERPGNNSGGHTAAYSKLLLQMLGAVGEFERALIRERQREGIAIAKTKGVYKGRKSGLNAEMKLKLREMIASGISKTEIAKNLAISRASVYQYIKAM